MVRLVPAEKFTQILAVSPAPPIVTAAENVHAFFKERGVDLAPALDAGAANAVPARGTILLGTSADTPAIARWVEEGCLSISASGQEGDAYEIAMLDGCVVLNGANARAVLYAAFEFEDVVTRHGGVPDGFLSRARPVLAQRLLHPRMSGGFHGYRKSDFEFVVRSGGNIAHLSHDWMREKTLFSFVPSIAFPNATDATVLERNRASMRRYLDWCRLYGLSGALWLCEMPCQGGPWTPEPVRKAFLERFPADCLADTGTYQGKLPCLAHPQVEQEYRRMMRQFLTDFPEISMFLIFTGDSSGELCDPLSCPRHHEVSKLTQYNRLLALMAEEGRKIRPDFQVISVGWGWKFRGSTDFFPQQAASPAGVGLTLPADGEAWSFDRKTTDELEKARALTHGKRQTFLGYDIFFWGDDTVFREVKENSRLSGLGATKAYDFPFGIAAKLRRWQRLGVDGFFDQWGTMSEYVQCNAVALRELTFHPELLGPDKVEEWAHGLAERRFGRAAAPHVLAAWKEIEAAQQLQSDHLYYWHHLRPAWSAPVLQCPLTLEALTAAEITHNGSSSVEPSKPHGSLDYSPYRDDVSCSQALAPALRRAAGHFGRALGHLYTATAQLTEDDRSALDHWQKPEPGGPARFTPRKALEEQIVSVGLQEQCQLRMSRFFEAWALVRTLPAPSGPGYREAIARLETLRAEDESRPAK